MKTLLIGILSCLALSMFAAGEPIQRNVITTNANPSGITNSGFVRMVETNPATITKLNTPGAPFTNWTFLVFAGASNTQGIWTNDGAGVLSLQTNYAYGSYVGEYLTGNPNFAGVSTLNAFGGATLIDNLNYFTNTFTNGFKLIFGTRTNWIYSVFNDNDIYTTAGTAADMITTASNFCTQVHLSGGRIVLWTIPDSRLATNRVHYTQQREIFNTWLRSDGAKLADYVVDVDRFVAGVDTNYYSDLGLAHFSPTVHKGLARLFIATLNLPLHTVIDTVSPNVYGDLFQPSAIGGYMYPSPATGGATPPANKVFVDNIGNIFTTLTNKEFAAGANGQLFAVTNRAVVVQAGNGSLVSSTVLTNSEMIITLPAGKWSLTGYAPTTSTGGGSKIQITASAAVAFSGTIYYSQVNNFPLSTSGVPNASSVNICAIAQAGDNMRYHWAGIIVTTTQDTTFTVQYAQNSSSATATVVLAGSWFGAERLE